LTEVVGTDGHFTTDRITDQLRNLIVARFATILGSSGIPVLDLAANYDQLGQFVHGRLAPEFANYGLELTTFLVENVSLPPAVEEAMDRRTSMGVIGDLKKYTQFQAAEAMRAAASNPADGGASAGIGMGMGMAMAKHFADSMSGGGQPAPAAATPPAPPPIPAEKSFFVARGGQPDGPFAVTALRQQRSEGRLTADDLVWAEGMAGWEKAAAVAELQAIFPPAPPPIPGA